MIRMSVLMNDMARDGFDSEHGLSLYVVTNDQRILFDFGKTEQFIMNAKKLNIDLNSVDQAVLSHGHYDHSGGIGGYVNQNKEVEIWCQKTALDDYYSDTKKSMRYIGIEQQDKKLDNFKLIDGTFKISDNMYLVANITKGDLYPSGNERLFKKIDDNFVFDDFTHEQHLVIKDGEHCLLISGCAHMGIVNIIQKAEEQLGTNITHVIGGFHMSRGSKGTEEDEHTICQTAKYFKEREIEVWTAHCTGESPYRKMKDIYNKINLLYAGDEVIIIK